MGKVARAPAGYSHVCLEDLLTFGMCLGVFPLDGIRGTDPSGLKFKWFSLKAVYSYSLLGGMLFCCLVFGGESLRSEAILRDLSTALYYFHVSGNILLSVRMARDWPRFMRELHEEEKSFLKEYQPADKLRRKINVVAAIVTLLRAGEIVLGYLYWYSTSGYYEHYDGLEHVTRRQFRVVYQTCGYNPILMVYLLVLCFVGPFVWNFGDLIIVSLSVIVATRFDQIFLKMRRFVKTAPRIRHIETDRAAMDFWRGMRRDYNVACKMCAKVNGTITDAILLSYACNICFILLRIHVGPENKEGAIGVTYFLATFGFVVARVVVVSVYGGWLNEAARAPLTLLNAIPTENYNHQITGIINQIQTVDPTLTARNFFSINKSLVLSIAANVITYELILVQFDQSSLDEHVVTNITACL